jgi:Holliday junction resolvase
MSKYARKTDAAQPAVVAALRAAGVEVIDFSWVGRGVPDILAVHKGFMWWMEIKNARKASSKAQDDRTDAELEFARRAPVSVVRSPADALRVVGVEVVI